MNNSQWWKNGVIYQIYPKSFQDTTGSGTGDIQGIIKRLDYLQTLGIDAIWITPMYVSSQIDNGYDIADYRNIDPSYGTMADFEQLVAEAHKRNIRIVMDMVFNHSSTNGFKKAKIHPPNIMITTFGANNPPTGNLNSVVLRGNGRTKHSNIICIYLQPNRRI